MNHGMWNERMWTTYNRTSMARIPLELQNHVRETMFEAGVVRASECPSWRQVRRQNRDIFSIFFKIKVYCVFSLESPHWGDSNEYTQYIIFNIKKKITQNYSKSAAMRFFSKGLKNEFETAVENEPSVFEPLRVYCIIAIWTRLFKASLAQHR